MVDNDLMYSITGAIFEVSHNMGPGLLEKVYHKALAYELEQRGHKVESEKLIKVTYKDVDLGLEYYADLVVNDTVIIEIKSVKSLEDVHRAQLINYLRLTHKPLGVLVNFNTPRAEIERLANKYNQ